MIFLSLYIDKHVFIFLKKGLKFSALHSITELYEIGESQEGKMGEIY